MQGRPCKGCTIRIALARRVIVHLPGSPGLCPGFRFRTFQGPFNPPLVLVPFGTIAEITYSRFRAAAVSQSSSGRISGGMASSLACTV